MDLIFSAYLLSQISSLDLMLMFELSRLFLKYLLVKHNIYGWQNDVKLNMVYGFWLSRSF